jgi:class 3 adenylate cyclase/CheY-like chemotaxis protein
MLESETTPRPVILVVDDTPQNLSIMCDVLENDYTVKLANSGARALKIAAATPPDLILLDIVMPEMDGYEVCQRLKADPSTSRIPIIFVTALTNEANEQRGFDVGAVDYITKPISPPIVFARIRNHLALRKQTEDLEAWNRTLTQRIEEGIAERERLDRLRRFFSPAVADLLLAGEDENFLRTRRREIVVVFLDLRGYTEFTEMHGADEVMRVLGEYHAAMGELINAHSGTLERFTGDGMMIFFNDPVEIDQPYLEAVKMSIEMQARMGDLQKQWGLRGYSLTMGIGIAQGIATIGAIGFEGRRDYGAIGGVTNLAARLCSKSEGGQILVSELVARNSAPSISFRSIGEMVFKGFTGPQEVFNVLISPS